MSELRPWQSGESILDAVRRCAAAPDDGFELPDEAPPDPSRVRWSSGAWEGVATHHMAADDEPGLLARARRRLGRQVDPAARIAACLADLARRDGDRERLALYRAALDADILGHVDDVLGRVAEEPSRVPAYARHARWLVCEARHRGPAKLAIALLGVCGDADDVDLIVTFARHDEFTLYCAVAVTNLLADPVDALWEMARGVDGWGKIHAVERLAPLVEHRPDVRRWLLVDGCANAVMDEYLAYPCATAGRLAAALDGDVDGALLDGACRIVGALCRGGPAEELDDYADGPVAVERLIGHLATRCTTLERLDAVSTLAGRLEHAEEGAAEGAGGSGLRAATGALGWTGELSGTLAATCREILARPEWPARVRAAFASGDRMRQWLAWRMASEVGIDLWDAAFAMLEDGPLDDGAVFRLMSAGDPERRRRMVAWAEEHLPLQLVATGPERRLFPDGETAAVDQALTFVVQEMGEGELYSELLVAAALRSPVISTRNGALNALEVRPRERWGSAVHAALRRSEADDPDDDVRARVVALLR